MNDASTERKKIKMGSEVWCLGYLWVVVWFSLIWFRHHLYYCLNEHGSINKYRTKKLTRTKTKTQNKQNPDKTTTDQRVDP